MIGSKSIFPGIIQYFTKKNLYMQKLEQSIVKHYFLILFEQRQDIQVFRFLLECLFYLFQSVFIGTDTSMKRNNKFLALFEI